jgi:hypothetical protein
MPTINTITREQWLQNAVTALTPLFSAKGYSVPNCHVSCGFASTDVKRGHIGQCWSTKASADKVNQIFISPAFSDSVVVLDTLMHELIHAFDDCENKHGPVFKKMALKLGLKGPMRSAGAGPELKAVLWTEVNKRLICLFSKHFFPFVRNLYLQLERVEFGCICVTKHTGTTTCESYSIFRSW